MKKIPWGIIAGSCAVVAFFTLLGTVALYIVFNGIASQTGDTASLFDNWYQTLLFVCAIVFGAGSIGSTAMFFVSKAKKKEGGTA